MSAGRLIEVDNLRSASSVNIVAFLGLRTQTRCRSPQLTAGGSSCAVTKLHAGLMT